jgi:hypothetical protein
MVVVVLEGLFVEELVGFNLGESLWWINSGQHQQGVLREMG